MTNPGSDFQVLIQGLTQTHLSLQGRAARSIDLALVVRSWRYGWHMVTFARAAERRAELYRKELITQISRKLAAQGIKGTSPTNLRQCRNFYLSYPKIHQTLSAESLPSERIDVLWRQFTLGWSRYVLLLTIDNTQERSFYEIEATANSWGVRELKRQVAASAQAQAAIDASREENAQIDLELNRVRTQLTVLQQDRSERERGLTQIADGLTRQLLPDGAVGAFDPRDEVRPFRLSMRGGLG